MGATMKRTYVWFAAAILIGMASLASAQSSGSLGDYARTVRKDKKPASVKQFDNDNLPTSDKLSVVGKPADSGDNSAQTAQPSGDQAQTSGQAEPKATGAPGETAEARQKMYDDWKQKIAGQKDKVDTLAKDLDLTQREYRLRAAAMYADVGNRLRNSAQWDKEDQGFKQQIEQKQKALNDAKQGLEDTQESARKAGVPASARE